MRRSNLEKLRDAKRKTQQASLQIATFDDLLKILCNGDLNPTQKEVLYMDTETPIAYMGRAGAAKTSTGCAGVFSRALFSPGSKWGIARLDYNDLKDTTMLRMQEMLNRLPPGILLDRNKEAPEKWYIRTIDPETGEEGEPAQFTFFGLKDDKGSYEFHGGFVDEADEIVEEKAFLTLMGRYRLPEYKRWLMLAFNGPPETHWLYTACTGLDAKHRKVRDPYMVLKQPKFGENAANLRAGYYEDLMAMYSHQPAILSRLVKGEWVATFEGLPVYPEYNEGFHRRKAGEYNPYSILYRFWDFGFNHPICLWAQVDDRGRLIVFREESGERIEIRPFAQLCKARTMDYFPDVPQNQILDFGDPAARQKKDTGSTMEHLMREGITLRYQLSHILPGVRAVRERLKMVIGGLPGLLVDESCTVLNAALAGGYRCRENNPNEPLKDGYYDNIADALRYGVINLFGTVGDRNPNYQGIQVPDNLSYQGGGFR